MIIQMIPCIICANNLVFSDVMICTACEYEDQQFDENGGIPFDQDNDPDPFSQYNEEETAMFDDIPF